MNREETLARYALGAGAWNKWANEMLADRKKLEDAGEWEAERNAIGTLEPKNSKTQAWFLKAEANFSTPRYHYAFNDNVNCETFIFPANTRFDYATFENEVWFQKAVFCQLVSFKYATFNNFTSFSDATFKGNALFKETTFNQETVFNNHTRFYRDASFINTTFKQVTSFEGATFYLRAYFTDVTFDCQVSFDSSVIHEDASFDRAIFCKTVQFENFTVTRNVSFDQATFSQTVRFNNSTFNGDASFITSVFMAYTNFKEVHFNKNANFTAIRAHSAFSLEGARFKQHVPNFTQAHFEEAPRLDHIELGANVEPGGFWRSLFTPRSPDIKARYQALKRLAIQAHDHENEQEFWAGELRSDRSLKTEDNKWKLGPIGSAFWWGNIAYGFFSNYGRSILRPFMALITVISIMTGIHLWAHNPSHQTERASTDPKNKIYVIKKETTTPCSPIFSAVHLATSKSFLYLGSDPSKRSVYTQSYTCLYGTKNDQLKTPNIPKCIIIAEFFQTLLSAILIFLLLLGIRNKFKLK